MTITIIIITIYLLDYSKDDLRHNVTKYLDTMVFIFNLKEIMNRNMDIHRL